MKRVYRQGMGVGAAVALGAAALALVNRQQPRDTSLVAAPDYLATITTDFGTITLRLLTSKAPNAVTNIVRLVNQKFYDGLSFHQVSPEQGMIATGKPRPGQEPDWTVPLEENGLPCERAAVAMFHPLGSSDENKCMFMILVGRRIGLTGMVTVFGRVVEGMDVVDRISRVETTGEEGNPPWTPLEPVMIHTMTVREIS